MPLPDPVTPTVCQRCLRIDGKCEQTCHGQMQIQMCGKLMSRLVCTRQRGLANKARLETDAPSNMNTLLLRLFTKLLPSRFLVLDLVSSRLLLFHPLFPFCLFLFLFSIRQRICWAFRRLRSRNGCVGVVRSERRNRNVGG